MKNLLLLYVLFSFFTSRMLCSLQIDLQYEILGMTSTLDIQGQNLSYILESRIYANFWNNTVINLFDTPSCSNSSNVVMTSNLSTYCLKVGNTTYLNNIQPSNAHVLQQFEYQGSNTGALFSNDEYLILTNNNASVFSADIFDTTTEEFYCHISSFDLEASINDLFALGDALILIESNARLPFNSRITYFSCNEGTYISTPFNGSISNVQKYNHSSLFVMQTFNYKTFNFDILPFSFDLTGIPYFGTPRSLMYSYYQFDDSLILISDTDYNNQDNYQTYYVNSLLKTVPYQNLNTGLSANIDSFSYVEDDTSLLMSDDSLTLLYNLESKNITHIWNSIPPIILNNGSIVNITTIMGGYFIQSPGEPVYFIFFPYDATYYSQDYDNIWLFYNPQYDEYDHYPNCTLTQIQKSTSSIKTFTMNECTCFLQQQSAPYYSIFNVTVDANGLPTIIYTCSDNIQSALIANTTNQFANIPFGFGIIPYITTYVEGNFITMVYLDDSSKDYIITRYNITEQSKVGKGVRIPTNNYENARIGTFPDGNILLLSSDSKLGTSIYVFDVNAFQVVKQIKSPTKVKSNLLPSSGIYLMGVNPQNITNFGGILVTSGLNEVYIIDNSGNATKINTINQTFTSVYPDSNNSFFLIGSVFTDDIIRTSYYNISSW